MAADKKWKEVAENVWVGCRYVEWICRAEDLVLAEDRTTEDDRKLIMEARQKAAEKMKKLSKTNKNDSVETNSLDETEGKLPDAGQGSIS